MAEQQSCPGLAAIQFTGADGRVPVAKNQLGGWPRHRRNINQIAHEHSEKKLNTDPHRLDRFETKIESKDKRTADCVDKEQINVFMFLIGSIGVIGVKPFAIKYSRDMPSASTPKRTLSTTLVLVALWIAFYGSFTLFTPALLDDADSVHAEVAREMLLRHDWTTLYANGIRYLEKAPLLYWSMAASMGAAQLLGHGSARCLAVAARVPLALTILALAFAAPSTWDSVASPSAPDFTPR
jgi:hypothetical protein